MSKQQENSSRRAFLKKAAYTAPVVLTLSVKPSMASTGSAVSQLKREEEQSGTITNTTGDNKIVRVRHRRKKETFLDKCRRFLYSFMS